MNMPTESSPLVVDSSAATTTSSTTGKINLGVSEMEGKQTVDEEKQAAKKQAREEAKASPLVTVLASSTTIIMAAKPNLDELRANVTAKKDRLAALRCHLDNAGQAPLGPEYKGATIGTCKKELIDAERTFAQHNNGIGVDGMQWNEVKAVRRSETVGVRKQGTLEKCCRACGAILCCPFFCCFFLCFECALIRANGGPRCCCCC